MMSDLPAELPALSAKNIHIGDLDGPGGTHCLVGWVYASSRIDVQRKRLAVALDAAAGLRRASGFNDHNPPAKSARLWNHVAKSLGYVREGKRFVLPEKR